MNQNLAMSRARLTTPRVAAIAGILFSLLLISSLVIIRLSIPADPRDAGRWLAGDRKLIELALTLLPFAGIAFLWFIGVVRDRLDKQEDRLFATVFLGSGLLFLAMLFAAAAVAGGLLIAFGDMSTGLTDSCTYAFARAATYVILNTYAIKMAGVFMISTCTLFLRTRVTAWLAMLVVIDNGTRRCLRLPIFISGVHVTAAEIVSQLRQHWPPEIAFVISDNGAQFIADAFRQFAQDMQFLHVRVARQRP